LRELSPAKLPLERFDSQVDSHGVGSAVGFSLAPELVPADASDKRRVPDPPFVATVNAVLVCQMPTHINLKRPLWSEPQKLDR
jgi:hypothetical protein